MRPSGREFNALRPVSIETGFSHHAEGSALIRMGGTEVLCTASVEGRVPPFMRGQGEGWVTAEYGMLPRATHTRGDREAARGKQSGRTQEIQRLIGRSLRAVLDRKAMGEITVTLDCDVLNADGGTRCASITGAYVAMVLAFRHLKAKNVIKSMPMLGQVAAVSCGIVQGHPVLDLDYAEDSSADADANFILTAAGGIVEIQATAEKSSFDESAFNKLLGLAREGTAALFVAQKAALG
ncbi:ribonuclease PH [Acidocella sp.]|uniref:ribonuclease PH n=1 Tax=Acidocella sp. TaxID=50710 RepID=UPI003D05E102